MCSFEAASIVHTYKAFNNSSTKESVLFTKPVVAEAVYFLPLGGTGEIGMNLNLYIHKQRMIMVDCGAMFQDPDDVLKPRNDEMIIPDTRFVQEHRAVLDAIILTHAHEDHIGALLSVWPLFPCKIFASPFAAEVLKAKVARARKPELQAVLSALVVIEPGKTYQIGVFDIRWVPMTHSTLESHGLLIESAECRVFHTGDWKLDAKPVLGPKLESSAQLRLATTKVDAVVCDSTNALKEGRSVSEHLVYEGLRDTIRAQTGRVFVTCFASNVARLVSVAKATKASGRYLAMVGRAFETMVAIARRLDYWPAELKIYDARETLYLPKEEVVYLVTGSQGESRAALSRLSKGAFRGIEMEAGDSVIFSSMRIPGNELEIARLATNLKAREITVIENSELVDLYTTLKPKIVVPTHGTTKHIAANASTAKRCGVRRALEGVNGDLFQLYPRTQITRSFADTDRFVVSSP